MVQFHEHIISDLLEDSNGGLVILSSGLALHKLISSLLVLHSSSQGTLLILSASPSQKSSITHSLLTLNPNPNNSRPTEITSDLSVQHRHSLYSSSSIFFITSRILIVDLLTSKLPTSKISGLIILNAHNLSDTCTEAFIVRIFRSLNRDAYVRAFSDKPHSMVSGFAKAERIVKSLYLRKLYLWPRFQVYVSQDLEKNPPIVVDIRVSLSPNMEGIQKAVIEAMGACLKEIRKTNKVDVEDLTLENGLFKSFDEIVRRQLDPIWHTLGRKTKQLVSDLKTLRKLLDYLVRYDAVTYLKYLDTLRVSEGGRSVWIFAESSYKIFEFAKKRVYRLVQSDGVKFGGDKKDVASKKRKVKEDNHDSKEVNGGSSSTSTGGVALNEVLEEAPKWKVLREVLEEIEEERQKQVAMGEEHVEDVGDDNFTVLIACKDERSCMQLEDCIKNGPQQVMREEWGKYLQNKAELHVIQKRIKKKSKDPKGFGILNGVVQSMPKENANVSIVYKLEHDALLAAASEISSLATKETILEDNPQPLGSSGGSRKGKGKVRPKNGPSNAKSSKKTSKGSNLEVSGLNNEGQKGDMSPIEAGHTHTSLQIGESVNEGVLKKHSEETNRTENAKSLPPVHFYALESHQDVLDIVKPSVVIVYHPDMTFVREVEIYKAENPSKLLKVYFLFYEDSTEVQKFEASIRRENGAFESLIRQKSLMMIPTNQDELCPGLAPSSGPEALNIQNSITRKAGGRKPVEKEMQVIVDMREFMSSLPNVLHMKGMRIIPVTLEVGDYVLSPSICVERKSIMDLFQSFASGRLYHQVEMMSRYYQIPVLLIEFLQDKSFSFQSASDIGDDVTPTSIISKLSLLVMHFPRLRLVWSRSLHATAEIFASLKANQDEPDETKAMRVGVPSDEGIVENDVRSENYNTSAVEFLRRLPGVTDSNYRALMDGCASLAELAVLPVERLAELMGGQRAARTLRDFLDAKYPTLT
ncbi:Dna repair endonuclease uvh1 [Thalictrum thalictroides]|uniref:Dna repair endonuclease uvh1 n=1 Tax=Thalictrum thalictroides TaxID=46969 RepID=A0A7J6UZ20_THATH|nr:Dna repair endonuclease uvh1 [Thalictrum thalictroides]